MDINQALKTLLTYNVKTFRMIDRVLDQLDMMSPQQINEILTVLPHFIKAGRVQNERVLDALQHIVIEPATGDEEVEFQADDSLPKREEIEGAEKEIKWLEKEYGSAFKENWFQKRFGGRRDSRES